MSPYRITDWLYIDLKDLVSIEVKPFYSYYEVKFKCLPELKYIDVCIPGIDEKACKEAESLAARVYRDWKATWKEQEK